MISATHAEWFLRERGIRPETLDHFQIDSDGNVLLIPYGGGIVKHRRGIPDGERKMWMEGLVKGMGYPLFNGQEGRRPHVFLCEGESDTMRLWQEFNDLTLAGGGAAAAPGVVGIGGVDTWHEGVLPALQDAERVYVCLDNDTDYMVQTQVDGARERIRRDLGARYRPVKLPRGVKDICEFFESYDLDAFRLLIADSAKASFHFEPLDITKDPGPINWMVDGLFCHGDLSLLIGEPGSYKSWLMMSLAVAVAQGHDTWAGRKLNLPDGHGRVLYVDEENPPNLVPHRMRKLGLTSEGAANIRYLNRQHVRLDRQPGKLLDEAINYRPDIIMLDSLTRLHTQDENAAGPMALLFNDGIAPLADKTGAAVMLLHHVNKSDGNSSFGRTRGSSDIPAAVDCALDVRSQGLGTIAVALFKSRWKQSGEAIHLQVADTPDGRTEVRPNPEAGF